MQVFSKSTVVDNNTLGLFDEGVGEVSPFPEKVVKPHSKPTSSPVIRKSIQDYPHDESVEGLKDKYINTSQGIDGYEDSLYLPNGEEVNGTWRLVDAFSISPSHDPFTFHSTKGFPRAGGGSSANTRDYANEPDAQLQVVQLAGDFDGRALGFDSAVVVTKDGVVISGNNRTMSSQLAARKGTDKKYVGALMKRCRSFGFSPEQVQAFEHPRVVFEIDSQDYSPEHFDKYNQSDKKEQSEEARIIKFSKVVKPNVLRDIADVASRFQWDLTQVFAIPAACEEMMTVFIKNKVFSQAELPRYFDGNKISSAGKQFLYEYILGGVLNESVVRALYSEGMGNLKQNVIGSVQLLLQNWACGNFSVIDELNSAIRYAIAFITDINNKKFVVPKIDKEEAKTMTAEDKVAFNLKAFNVWASQGDLLEDKHPLVLKLAGALIYSASLFKDYLTRLNEATASAAKTERETTDAGNVGLFEEDFAPDRYSLLEKAVASWQRRNAVKRSILSSVLRGDLFVESHRDWNNIFSSVSSGAGVFTKLGDVLKSGNSFTVENKDLGFVSIDKGSTGKNGYGLLHIIEGRHKFDNLSKDALSAVIYKIIDAVENGQVVSKQEHTQNGVSAGRIHIEKDGVLAIVSLAREEDVSDRFVLTGFAIHGKEKEATDAIQTVIAQYGYSPEFSYFRSQVGAVTASLNQSYSNFLDKASVYKNGGFMKNNTMLKSQAVFSDLKDKIMKWTAQSPENKKAYQQAMSLFRENFGKHPQTEKDAKVIMKTAQQMAKTGQIYSDDSFKQVAQQVMNEGGGQSQQTQTQQPQGGSQQAQGNSHGQQTQGGSRGQSSGGVSPQDPVALFKAIQALYKSGAISKEQVEKAFAMVTGQQAQGQQSQGQDNQQAQAEPQQAQGQQTVYNMPDQTQDKDQQQEPLAASLVRSGVTRPHISLKSSTDLEKSIETGDVLGFFRFFGKGQIDLEKAKELTGLSEDSLYEFEREFKWADGYDNKNSVLLRWAKRSPLYYSFGQSVQSSGKNPGVVFDRLPKGVTGLQIGSRVVYTPMKLSSSLPVAMEDKNIIYAGKEGIIKSISSELYNVEMPEDEEIISAYGNELTRVASDEEILSARGNLSDPMRESVQQFLSNIPTLTQVPENYKDERIVKERLEPDHVCYWYSETITNGKPYTVEFHVSPGEPFCDVYVVRDFDNTPLDAGGYHIEDFEDWNLSEVDYVEGLFAKEQASTGKEASFDKDKRGTTPYKVDETDPYLADRVSARFNRWSAQVAAGLSLGKGMSLPDMAVVSGLARVLSGGSWAGDLFDERDYKDCGLGVAKLSRSGWDDLYNDGVLSREEWFRGYDYNGNYELEDREQRPAKTSKGDFFGMNGSVNSSLEDGFNKTLTTVDKLTHNPLSAVDDVAALPFKFLDKVTGKGKVKSSLGF